ncbi:MAG: N-acetylmuramoyl-L-alanine amidase-like domain-containing protein [Microcoleus sp.]
MRKFLTFAVLGFTIASINSLAFFPFATFSSHSAAVAGDSLGDSFAARTLVSREVPNLEPTKQPNVLTSSNLFWNFKNAPEISSSQLLDLLVGRSDSNDRASGIVARAEDLAKFDRVMEYAKKHNLQGRSMGEIVQAIADKFLGKPYAAGLLDKSNEEKLIVTLNEFDCVLFVETVLALSRGIAVKDYNYQNFVRRIEEQRYLNGKMNGYCSRLHYFSEWIDDNNKRQTVENITVQLGGIPMDKKLNFMSQHRSSYPQMAKDEATYQCRVGVEADLAKTTVNYLPTNRIKSVYSQLKPGDIVAVATDIKGLDVTHTGFVYRNAEGNLGLIHASPAGKVTVASDLQRYISRVDNAIGIVVARAIDPR